MHEVSVPVPPAVLDAEDQDGLVAEFARTYAVLFAAPPMGAAVEALTWRVRAAAPPPPVTLPRLPAARSLDPTVALKRSRSAVVDGGGRREVPVYDRYKLAPGMALEGPSLVEERETTLLVPAGTIARVDAHGIIRVANTLEDSATS
jgi:N-methylhydantoinase A/oxoprolinase/acetone carboxylase beta subunit